MDLAPDGRIFVTGQKGKLWVVDDDGAVTNPLTLSGVKFDGERGLVGITLDPDFATNGHVFLYYTKIDDGLGRHNRVVRYTFSGNEVVGGPVSILELPDIGGATFHMGGSMHFGP